MSEISDRFTNLKAIIAKLRQPEGCPWDKRQTISSFRPYLIEEFHELLEAIDLDDHQLIKEELGDLIFQVLFVNNLYEEKNIFTLEQVLDTITSKMIRRHPHVFGEQKIGSDGDLRRSWNRIKNTENTAMGKPEKGLLSLPRSLPALLRAQRISVRAVNCGFEWPDLASIFLKLDEEITELHEAIATGNPAEIEDEIGDILFTMVNVARKAGYDAETSLQKASDKFTRRFNSMCELVAADGGILDNLSIAAMQSYWQAVKSQE